MNAWMHTQWMKKLTLLIVNAICGSQTGFSRPNYKRIPHFGKWWLFRHRVLLISTRFLGKYFFINVSMNFCLSVPFISLDCLLYHFLYCSRAEYQHLLYDLLYCSIVFYITFYIARLQNTSPFYIARLENTSPFYITFLHWSTWRHSHLWDRFHIAGLQNPARLRAQLLLVG